MYYCNEFHLFLPTCILTAASGKRNITDVAHYISLGRHPSRGCLSFRPASLPPALGKLLASVLPLCVHSHACISHRSLKLWGTSPNHLLPRAADRSSPQESCWRFKRIHASSSLDNGILRLSITWASTSEEQSWDMSFPPSPLHRSGCLQQTPEPTLVNINSAEMD